MPFDVAKKTQLTVRVNNTIADFAAVEQTLLSGARDATVTRLEREVVYELLRSMVLLNKQLDAVLAAV